MWEKLIAPRPALAADDPVAVARRTAALPDRTGQSPATEAELTAVRRSIEPGTPLNGAVRPHRTPDRLELNPPSASARAKIKKK